MRLIIIMFILLISSCGRQRENLDYPKDINEISEVTLNRHNKESNGESAEIKKLSKEEVNQLLHALENSKAVGLTKFIPDYYIIFTTKTNGTKKFRINGNIIKGYDNDISYKIENIGFLINF
jgi:hypothetical protein